MTSHQPPNEWSDDLDKLLPEDAAARKQLIDEMLAACRSYLMVVAYAELSRDVAVKVAPSDIVQETLLEAHADADRFRGHTREELLAWLDRSSSTTYSMYRGVTAIRHAGKLIEKPI